MGGLLHLAQRRGDWAGPQPAQACFRCTGIEACPLSSADFKSLEYVVVGAFMKIFNTRSKEVATSCMEMFNFPLPSVWINNRKSNFLRKLSVSDNIIFDCVLNMLTSIRPSIELCCLVVFDLSCNVLFCYFFIVVFVFYSCCL